VPRIDFAAHAASLGALSENVKTIPELEAALERARSAARSYVICIETDPDRPSPPAAMM
jgi:3D-(3,5/4)-trihydroxycyclohexane-1,2-dione acylhydrolase (decyclizing)